MAINGSTELRLVVGPSERDPLVDAPATLDQQNRRTLGANTEHGAMPVVVFLSVAFALWAILAMAWGQTLGRVITVPFVAVTIAAAVLALTTLGHAKRHGLRIVATVGDGVSVAVTAVLVFAARGLVNWPFLSPLTVADDAARHFGMVNWIAAHGSLPNVRTPELLQFSEYPMSAHYLAATIARTFGAIPLRVANMAALGTTYGLWMVLGSAVAFAWKRVRPHSPRWQQVLAAATVPLTGYATFTLSLWAVTASYFYAQVLGLWFAAIVVAIILTNPHAALGATLGATAKKRTFNRALPSWWAVFAVLMLGPSLVYPLHLVLTPAVVLSVVVVERRASTAALLALGMAAIGLGVQLPWLGAATKMSQEEGSILQPSFANLGGLTVLLLVGAGLVLVWRTRTETVSVLSVVLGAAQVGALALAHSAGLVSRYTSIKVISSLLPGIVVLAAFGSVSLAESLAQLLEGFLARSLAPKGPAASFTESVAGVAELVADGAVEKRPAELSGDANVARKDGIQTVQDLKAKRGLGGRLIPSFAPALAGLLVAFALVHAIRFPPLTGLTRPLVSADGYRVSRWASAHVDPNQVGIVAPGIEAYALWWTALDRKKDLAILRRMQPSSTQWSEWPEKSTNRYLIVITKGQAISFAARTGVKVVFRSGDAVLLERSS
jgi:hypothetical protein